MTSTPIISINWHGKSEARIQAEQPCHATLNEIKAPEGNIAVVGGDILPALKALAQTKANTFQSVSITVTGSDEQAITLLYSILLHCNKLLNRARRKIFITCDRALQPTVALIVDEVMGHLKSHIEQKDDTRVCLQFASRAISLKHNALIPSDDRYIILKTDKQTLIVGNIDGISDVNYAVEEQRPQFQPFDYNYNIYIEGDNLDALTALNSDDSCPNIKMIYIDPPYNTGKGFIYNDRYGADNRWIDFMTPRLSLAHKLLSDDGAIFISIDFNELKRLLTMTDDIFGQQNFIGLLSIENNPKGRKNSRHISVSNDYCAIYAKDISRCTFVENVPKDIKDMTKDENGQYIHGSGKRVLVGQNDFNRIVTDKTSDKNYTVWHDAATNRISFTPQDGWDCYRSTNSYGDIVENTYSRTRIEDLHAVGGLQFRNGKIYERNMRTHTRLKSMLTNRAYEGVNGRVNIDFKTTSAGSYLKTLFGTDHPVFTAPKTVEMMQLLISLFADKDMWIMDFFSGSATMGEAVERLNKVDGGTRRFILVQYPEEISTETAHGPSKAVAQAAISYLNRRQLPLTISEIGKERLRLAGVEFKVYQAKK